MDFDLPQDLLDLSPNSTCSSSARSSRSRSRTTTSASSTTAARTPAPTGTRAGCPTRSGRSCCTEAKRRADEAGHYRYPLAGEYGGRNGSNLGMAVIREHLARKGLGLHNDLQNEHSIVGNNVGLLLMIAYGTDEQKAEWIDDLAEGRKGFAFGITEPNHGSDATHMETTAVRDGDEWIDQRREDLEHRHPQRAVRHDHGPHQRQGRRRRRHHRVPGPDRHSPGFEVLEYLWTFNMPTDHAHIRSPTCGAAQRHLRRRGQGPAGGAALLQREPHPPGRVLARRGAVLHRRVGEVRAQERKPFGKPLASNQGIQFPLVELQTQCEMLRALIHKTAWQMDRTARSARATRSMCNYWANRLCCDAADRAMQVHGGLGYSRHKPFEHIYRHHRRYRITEGAEEIQMRRVAGYMFGFMNQKAPKGVSEG
jgi:acyl-CoA dehydrogenase